MLNRTRMSAAVLAAFGATVMAVPAAQAQQQGSQQLERVEITGSSLRRVDAETALPVTIIRTEDLAKQGVTTAEQAVQRIAASQSTVGTSQGIGATTGGIAVADLRGLGATTGNSGQRTLVLLNGRRIANHAYDSGATDLNAIPLAAIDRIEVLRDGASAIYGTDAIGGVINFILRRDFQGLEVTLQNDAPQAENGDMSRASLAAGFGSLNKQGFNLMFTLDYRKQDELRALDRSYASSGLASGATSGTTFPGTVNGFNPTAPTCNPSGLSVPVNGVCRFDFVGAIDLIPENEQLTALARGSLKLGDSVVSLEHSYAKNETINRVAPTPLVGMNMPVSSPFFPAGAPTTPDPAVVTWRAVPAGQRTNEVEAEQSRTLLSADGMFGVWDYKAGVMYSVSEVTDTFTNGYVNRSLVQAGLNAGTINPFGGQPNGGAALNAAKIVAPVLTAKGEVTAFDARVSRDLFQLSGGAAAIAVGTEFRKEEFKFDLQDIARQAASSGLELAADISGDRDVTALFAEMALPITRQLELTLAARYDNYSDFGNTVNPKVGIRYQPSSSVLFRGSFNTGFRAPTLYDIYQPIANTFTSDAYDDPLLCPNGTAVPPALASVVCNQQVQQRLSGPVAGGKPVDALDPEKSRTFSVGVVFEPVRNTTISIDYWDIFIEDAINALPEQAIFGDPVKYASRILRCSQLDAATRAVIDVCNNVGFDPIAYIDTPTENLGEIKTRGIDLGFAYRTGATPYGTWSFTLDGTYIDRFKYQRERGGEFISAAGAYSDNAPVLRWQHVAAVSWNAGGYGATLAQRHKSGYKDQFEPDRVRQYTVYDLGFTYTGVKNLTLQFVIKNLLNEDPPFSNQGSTFQANYDPRLTDPLGRTYSTKVSYRFW